MYSRFNLGQEKMLLLMDGVNPKTKYSYPLQSNPPFSEWHPNCRYPRLL
jgi:hypothetical protein